MLIGSRAAVDGLDVVGVHVDGSGGVLNDLVPLAHGAVAGGTVRVEDGVGLADDGLAVQVDGLVVGLVAVGLVSGLLELGSILLTLLGGQAKNRRLIDLGQLGLALYGGFLRLGGRGRGLGVGCFALGFLSLPPLLLAELWR